MLVLETSALCLQVQVLSSAPEKTTCFDKSFFQLYLPLRASDVGFANDAAYANDVSLRAHKGKYRIITNEVSNIIDCEAICIISP